ncbi:murein biosynthesis integral membrane protein MurJ [candidate division KSB1 bacterium]
MSANHKILQSGLLLFSLVFISKALAFLKDIILAYTFGKGELTDIYFIAFSIPHTLMYVMGITLLRGMSSSVFSGMIAKKEDTALSILFSTIFNGVFLFTAALSAICIWQMPALIRMLPFTFYETDFDMTVLLARILFPLLITLGLSDYCGAVLNAFRNFFLPGFSMILANLCMIVSLLLLSDSLSILSIAYGTAAGFLIALAVQFIFLIRSKIRYLFSTLNFTAPPVRSFIVKARPLILLTGISQISIFTSKIIALHMETGMVSALSYAEKVNEISISLFVLPLLTVLLPEFARETAVLNLEALKSRIRFGAEVIASIITFIVVFLIVFHNEVIVLLFQRGEFTVSDSAVTGDILLIFVLGLIFQAGYLCCVFIYLGMQKTKALTVVGILSYSVNIVLLFTLSHFYGVYGLAASFSITAAVYFLLLFSVFKKRYIAFSLWKQSRNLLKIAVSGVILLLSFYLVGLLFNAGRDMSFMSLAVFIAITGSAGLLFYMVLLNIFHVFEISDFLKGTGRYIRGQN